MVGAAVVGGAVIGAVGSNMAASTQANAAKQAAQMQADAANNMRGDLSPYVQAGNQAINPLWNAMGYSTAPNAANIAAKQAQLDNYIAGSATHPEWDKGQIQQQIQAYQQELADAQAGSAPTLDPNSTLQQKFSFDPSQLDQTPGYQFALQQGLRGTNNMLASQGLGLSGAQAKGLSSFATGLADQTYGNQYNRALSTYNTNYQVASNNVNNLQNMMNSGQNSAAQTGQAGMTGAANAGNFQTQAGNAQASGIMGMANAANTGTQNYMLYNALYPSASSSAPSFGSQAGNYLAG